MRKSFLCPLKPAPSGVQWHAAAQFILLLLLTGLSCGEGKGEKTRYDSADWSFVAIGDVRAGYDTYSSLLEAAGSYYPPPKFVVVTGDLISNPGNDQEWNQFLGATAKALGRMWVYTAVGNHDVSSIETQEIYKSVVAMPGNELYYSFTYDDYYFIVLDTEVTGQELSISGDQYTWLANELTAAQGLGSVQSIVVFFHRPLYSWTGLYGRIINTPQLLTLLESYSKVKMVITSHTHGFYYLRKNGILHVVSGGGGAPFNGNAPGEYYHFTKFGIYKSTGAVLIQTINYRGEAIESFFM